MIFNVLIDSGCLTTYSASHSRENSNQRPKAAAVKADEVELLEEEVVRTTSRYLVDPAVYFVSYLH